MFPSHRGIAWRGIKTRAETGKNTFLNLLFPKVCFGCETEGDWVCARCTETIPVVAPQCIGCGLLVPAHPPHGVGRTCEPCRRRNPVQYFFSPFSYREPLIGALIHALKYQRIRSLDAFFAERIAAYLAAYSLTLPSDAVLVPIPLHRQRFAMRGFNQAALLAGAVGVRLGIPVSSGALVKPVITRPQAILTREERLKNLDGSFAIADAAPIRGHTVILVDDVKTTGATLAEAARTLREAGARRVWAMTVAH